MDFVKMYHPVVIKETGKIWKIEIVFIPKDDVEKWRENKVFVTEEDLKELGINI